MPCLALTYAGKSGMGFAVLPIHDDVRLTSNASHLDIFNAGRLPCRTSLLEESSSKAGSYSEPVIQCSTEHQIRSVREEWHHHGQEAFCLLP